jgi:hypothetical protein
MYKELFLASFLVVLAAAAPQGVDQERYKGYEYSFKVDDPKEANYFDKSEISDNQGRVSYQS